MKKTKNEKYWTGKERVHFIIHHMIKNDLKEISQNEIIILLRKKGVLESKGVNKDELIGTIIDHNKYDSPSIRGLFNTHKLGYDSNKKLNPKIHFLENNKDGIYELIDSSKNNYIYKEYEEMLKRNSDENEDNKNVPVISENKSTRYVTDEKLKNKVIEEAMNTCIICGDEKETKKQSFLKNYLDNELYLEGHHVLPMKFQKEKLELNIDSKWNLVAICPKHHRELHYIDNKCKKETLEKLLTKYEEKHKRKFYDVFRRKITSDISDEEIINILLEYY